MNWFTKSPTATASIISSIVAAASSIVVANIQASIPSAPTTSTTSGNVYNLTLGEQASGTQVVINDSGSTTSKSLNRTPGTNLQSVMDQNAALTDRVSRLEGAMEIIKPLLLKKNDTVFITVPKNRAEEVTQLFSGKMFKVETIDQARQPANTRGLASANGTVILKVKAE